MDTNHFGGDRNDLHILELGYLYIGGIPFYNV